VVVGFKNSEMTCISCHNPHKSVKSLSANYFDKKCMDCHKTCDDDKNMSDCASCHMPNSSSIDIPHVSITDHKISIPKTENDIDDSIHERDFSGLFSINNNNPTNLSKAMAYLKRYEGFESRSIYLDSAFFYLEFNDFDKSFPYYIQYYYLQKDYVSLINFYLTIDPSIYDDFSNDVLSLAFSRIADAYSENGMVNEAIRLFNKSIGLSPLIIDYKLKLVALYIDVKSYDNAKKLLDNLLSLNSFRKEVYLNMGYLHILQGNYTHAKSNLNSAISLDPDYIMAYENLTLLNIKKNNLFLARKNLDHILRIDPNNIKAKLMLKQLN
jgi:tetratricopeptide (TPR) repeat protein